MTRRVGRDLLIEREPDRQCELCGKQAECRPYGPKGEQICFACGQKNPEATRRALDQRTEPQ